MGLAEVLLLLSTVITLGMCQTSPANLTAEELDSVIRDEALRGLSTRRTRTGQLLYKEVLAGVEVGAVRLKRGSFRSRGVKSNNVSIPAGVITSPYVRRLVVVYENLGNWSAHFYTVPGHRLVAPVVGFHVYNATTLFEDGGASEDNGRYRRLNISVTGEPIVVYFPALDKIYAGTNSTARCVSFDKRGGDYQFSDLVSNNACLTRTQGHFSVVVPLPTILPASPAKMERWGRRRWKLWLVVSVCGVAAMALVGIIWWVAWKEMEKKKMVKLEKESDGSEALKSVWIGGSRLPSASAIRTQPALEPELAP